MPTDLTDDELIDVPADNLRPGELTRAFSVLAKHDVKKQEEDVSVRLRTLTELQVRQDEEHDREIREDRQQREAILLASLQAREENILEQAAQLNKRTLRLDDGRRVYVDGDKYRDGEGRELHNHDRAEAEQLHLEHTDAATWQEHQQLTQQLAETAKLRAKVEALPNGGADDGLALAGYEKELKEQKAAQVAESPKDYGSTDYMTSLGLSGNFKQAALNAFGATAPDAPVQAQVSGKPKGPALP